MCVDTSVVFLCTFEANSKLHGGPDLSLVVEVAAEGLESKGQRGVWDKFCKQVSLGRLPHSLSPNIVFSSCTKSCLLHYKHGLTHVALGNLKEEDYRCNKCAKGVWKGGKFHRLRDEGCIKTAVWVWEKYAKELQVFRCCRVGFCGWKLKTKCTLYLNALFIFLANVIGSIAHATAMKIICLSWCNFFLLDKKLHALVYGGKKTDIVIINWSLVRWYFLLCFYSCDAMQF